MPFSPGSSVVVLTLGKKRGVIVEAGRGGRYRVLVDNAMVSCREEDLVAPPAERGAKRRAQEHGSFEEASSTAQAAGAAPAPRLDLHGLTVEDARARIIDAIDQALRGGADRIEVVHGKGSGRIRDALHRQLAGLPVVKAFRLDPRNPGVTWVYF